MPFILGGPCHRHYEFPHETEALLNHVDIAPTTLRLCGIDPPAVMDGVDLSGATRRRGLCDEELPDSLLLQSVVPTGHPPSVEQPWRGVVTRDGWKYVVFETGPYLLFDLNEDPGEFCNLAHHVHARPRRVALHAELTALLERVADPFAVPKL
ncbi:MAG: sulfatase/phosphatase domain-containing protein [Planctomycetota bacterium]